MKNVTFKPFEEVFLTDVLKIELAPCANAALATKKERNTTVLIIYFINMFKNSLINQLTNIIPEKKDFCYYVKKCYICAKLKK